MRRLALLLAFALLAAAPSPPPGSNDEFYVALIWNGVGAGQVLMLLAPTGPALARATLAAQGVRTGTCLPAPTDDCWISLASIPADLRASFDDAKLVLSVSTSVAHLPKKDLSLAPAAPTFAYDFLRGNALNWQAYWAQGNATTWSLDDRYSLAKNEVLEAGAGETFGGLVQRTYTDWTIDDPTDLRRTIVGDANVAGGDLGGSFPLGGIAVQRQWSLDPYLVTFPVPSLATAISTPSQAEIYVNGTLVKTVDLPPGYYDLSNIPIASGISNGQVVIRNAFGQTQTFNASTYGAATLLKPGLTDYQYAAGFLREDVGQPQAGYGPFAASASWRLGLSNRATVGGLVQFAGGEENAGGDLDALVGAGVLHVGLAASAGTAPGGEAAGVSGAGEAATVGWTTQGPLSSLSVYAQEQTRGYAAVSAFGSPSQIVSNAIATYARKLGTNASATLTEQLSTYRGEGTTRQTVLAYSRGLGAWSLTGSFSLQASPISGAQRGFSLSLIRTLGPRGTAIVSYQGGSPAGGSVQYENSSPTPLGTSWSATATGRPGDAFGGWAQIGAQAGLLQLALSPGAGLGSVSAQASGSVVSTGAGTFLAQPVLDGWALVETAGIAGAKVFNSGTYVGRTNANGEFVVPFLQSDMLNRLTLSGEGLPATDSLGAQVFDVGPGYHGGVVVRTKASKVHAMEATVRVLVDGKAAIPAYGEADLEAGGGKTRSSPINRDGSVFFDDVAEGRRALTVVWNGRRYGAQVEIPAFGDAAWTPPAPILCRPISP